MDVSKQVVSSAAAHVCGILGVQAKELSALKVMTPMHATLCAGMVIAVLASRAQAHVVSSCAW